MKYLNLKAMSLFKSEESKNAEISRSSDLPIRSAQEYDFLYDPDATQSQQASDDRSLKQKEEVSEFNDGSDDREDEESYDVEIVDESYEEEMEEEEYESQEASENSEVNRRRNSPSEGTAQFPGS